MTDGKQLKGIRIHFEGPDSLIWLIDNDGILRAEITAHSITNLKNTGAPIKIWGYVNGNPAPDLERSPKVGHSPVLYKHNSWVYPRRIASAERILA
jgi:hypothetical protein